MTEFDFLREKIEFLIYVQILLSNNKKIFEARESSKVGNLTQRYDCIAYTVNEC